ncbi:MAG: patatin-like phospholipase family protein [Brevundimonas sp.]|uniref:patatin-like phospholipase family protein n=1 Tax=Brevundimonas sp. TaxID=1871086 RepID=UPI0025C69B4E|nr:patatin-like phospholipase family protein [Brevundimonas sp.]MBX3476199.1 patatin-like phospholipase family protein [Brevundimonas sp.]
MSTPRPDTLEAALARVFEGRMIDRASWFALTGGEALFHEGDPADTLYLVRNGRLGVFRHEPGQPSQFIGVVRPGEPVGEMAMLAGAPHTASVVALRDSEILALPRDAFFEAARTEPDLMVELSRLMIQRARDRRSGAAEPSVFGFIGLRPRPVRPFVDRVAAAIQAMGFTCRVIDHSALSSATEWFSRVEDAHDYVLYVAEADEPAWAALCARQVDRVFMIGNPLLAPPAAPPRRPGPDAAHRQPDLILLRDARLTRPANTRIWLDALNPGRWFHVAEGVADDASRIARVVTGTAVGVVFSGGGARAYAHIGVVQALHEARVPFDFVGGASMGAVVGAGPALGWTDAELEAHIRQAFVRTDPLSDIAFPIVAMTRARKVERLLHDAYGEIEIEDMPLPFFCTSSNLTNGQVQTHRRGLLRQAMRASISIPGVMPPVVMDDQVLVDGAVLKNFPAEIMRQMTNGPIVGSDVSQARGVDPASLENPSWLHWLVSGAWKKGPPIVAVLMRSATLTTDAEIEASRAITDLLIQPTPEGMDIRDWKAYDAPVEAGYGAAVAALSTLNGPVTMMRRQRRVSDDAPSGTHAETAAGSSRPPASETPAPGRRRARPGRPG